MQTFAWARMFAGYAKSMSFSEALIQTFDPEKPCELCLAVRKAKQHDNNAPPTESKLREKIDLVYQPLSRFIGTIPESARWALYDCRPISAEKSAPPVPPPRAVVQDC